MSEQLRALLVPLSPQAGAVREHSASAAIIRDSIPVDLSGCRLGEMTIRVADEDTEFSARRGGPARFLVLLCVKPPLLLPVWRCGPSTRRRTAQWRFLTDVPFLLEAVRDNALFIFLSKRTIPSCGTLNKSRSRLSTAMVLDHLQREKEMDERRIRLRVYSWNNLF